jgi:hypothetical protein
LIGGVTDETGTEHMTKMPSPFEHALHDKGMKLWLAMKKGLYEFKIHDITEVHREPLPPAVLN